MAGELEILKQLQAIDGELFQLRKQQRDKPRELEQVQAEVAAQEAKGKAATDRHKSLQVAQKAKEMDLQSREGHVKKLQGQLFQLKTNKEYAAMQREIDALKADNSLLEEEIIGFFDEIERAGKDRQAEEQRMSQQQQRLSRERQRIEQELAVVTGEMARLEQSRQGLLPQAPPKTLEIYERVLALREGRALVPLMSDTCGGCHRRMPPQVVNEVFLKNKLVTCEHCSRILYFDEAHSKL